MSLIKESSFEVKVYYPKGEVIDFDFIKEIKDHILFDKESPLNFELVKDDKGDVYQVEFNEEIFYIKYYKHRSFNKVIKRFLRGAYGLKNLKIAKKLLESQINSVDPFATLVYKKSLLYVDSIFIMKETKGFELYDYLSKYQFDYKFKKDLIKKIAKLWAELFNNKFLHKDPTLFNLFITWEDNDFNLSLVDIDNIYKLPFITKGVMIKSLFKFNEILLVNCYNLGIKLGKKEAILFYREFLENLEDKEIKLDELINKVGRGTMGRLKRKGKFELFLKMQDGELSSKGRG